MKNIDHEENWGKKEKINCDLNSRDKDHESHKRK